jgi:uncharacterized coiled-coil DUF342 family protein
MTEVEQLRKDYEHMKNRRAEAEQYLVEERAKVNELMQAIKHLRERFELLQTEFDELTEEMENDR